MLRLSLIAVLALATSSGYAETTPSPTSQASTPQDEAGVVRETVVVSATRSERELSDVPVSTTVIREAEIRSAPAIALDDLVRTIPGVHMPLGSQLSNNISNHRFSMRGLGAMRALVMMDGIPIHDPYYGVVEWQKVPLDTLQQVEVVRGGNASLFGNNALGGTINLVTRPVESNEIALDSSYGSFSTARVGVSVDQRLSRAVGVRLSHHRYDSNGFVRVPNPGLNDDAMWNDTAISTARFDLQPTDAMRAWLKAGWSQIDASQGTHISYSTRGLLDLAAGVNQAVGRSGILSASFFRQHEDLRLVDARALTRDTEVLSADSDIPASHSGASLSWSTDRSGPIAFISVGIDVQERKADEDRQAFNTAGVATQRVKVKGDQRFAGLFGQASWRPNDRLEVLASGRVDYYRNANGSETTVGGTSTKYPETTSTQFDPRVSVRYALSERVLFRAAAFRAFNAPTIRELYRTNTVASSTILNNPDLLPETIVGADAGIGWASRRARFEVALYRSDGEAMQVRVPVAGRPGFFQNRNVGETRSQGVEASADVQITSLVRVTAGYTYADSVIVRSPGDPTIEGNMIPEVVPHIGTISLRYTPPRGPVVDLRGRVLSRSFGETTNTVAAPAHRVLDISVSQEIRSWITAYAVLENAFDDEYFYPLTPTSFRLGMPRTFTAGLRMRFPAALFGGKT